MKVIRITDEDTKLTKRQRQQVAILKLTDNGKYVENVGIKDNEFYLLVETDNDDMYLTYMAHPRSVRRNTRDEVVKMMLIMVTEHEINVKKAELQGKEWANW